MRPVRVWLGFLMRVVTVTGAGDVVEADELDAIEAAFVADVPGVLSGEIALVVDAGLELVGGLCAVADLAVVAV